MAAFRPLGQAAHALAAVLMRHGSQHHRSPEERTSLPKSKKGFKASQKPKKGKGKRK